MFMNLLPLYSLHCLSFRIFTSTDFNFFFVPLVQPAIQQALPGLGFVSLVFGKQTFLNAMPFIFPSAITSVVSFTFGILNQQAKVQPETLHHVTDRVTIRVVVRGSNNRYDLNLSYTEISIG